MPWLILRLVIPAGVEILSVSLRLQITGCDNTEHFNACLEITVTPGTRESQFSSGVRPARC